MITMVSSWRWITRSLTLAKGGRQSWTICRLSAWIATGVKATHYLPLTDESLPRPTAVSGLACHLAQRPRSGAVQPMIAT